MFKSIPSILISCLFASLAQAQTGNAPNFEQRKSEEQWTSFNSMPQVCVATRDEKTPPHSLSIWIPSQKSKEVTYTTQVPVKAIDGLRFLEETRVKTVSEQFMERRELPLEECRFLNLQGKEIPQEIALKTIASPTHVFWNMLPDAYHRSVVRDDVMVLRHTPPQAAPATSAPANPSIFNTDRSQADFPQGHVRRPMER